MFNIRHFINDTDFQIVYINKKLDIVNYEKINYMEDEKISLSYHSGTIVIKGENLRVQKLLDNEIVIVGEIENIDFRKYQQILIAISELIEQLISLFTSYFR